MAWVQAYLGRMDDESVVVQMGGQPESEVALCALLKEHGVFADRVVERSNLLLRKL